MSVDTRVESISRTAEHSIGTSSIQMTFSVEHVEEEELVELELGLLDPMVGQTSVHWGQMSVHSTAQGQSEL
jgi:hypothetical protein